MAKEIGNYRYDERVLKIGEEVKRMEESFERARLEKGPGAAAAFIRLSRLRGIAADIQSGVHEVHTISHMNGEPEVICSCGLMIPEAEYNKLAKEEWESHPGHLR